MDSGETNGEEAVLDGYIDSLVMRGLDRRHPVFSGIDWGASMQSLVPALAPLLREAVVIVEEPKPVAPNDPAPGGNSCILHGEKASELAARLERGTWISVGRPFKFPDGVDFRATDPDATLNASGAPTGEWIWQLNRHWEWGAMARLYLGTGDERYAKLVCSWIRRWLTQSPPPSFDCNARQATWRTIEIGIRLAGSWTTVLGALRRFPGFDDRLFCAWLGAWAEQAYFTWQHRKSNNWLHMEMNGLVHAGVALPFHRDAARWRRDAIDALVESVHNQVHPDGMQFELSASYHLVCISNYRRAAEALKACGHTVPESLTNAIALMHEPLRQLARPDGTCWNFQDSHAIKLGNQLRLLPENHRGANDGWFIDGSGNPPVERHSLLKYAGYGVLRSGWEKHALNLAFDGGPFGAAHQHEDKLSFQLMAHGTDLIGEAGIVDYADSPQRRYSSTTLAHSTALVDGAGQNRRHGFSRDNIDLLAESGLESDLHAEVPWLRARYCDGYGPERIAVTHERTIGLAAEDLVIIRDHFVANDGAEHRIELLFHVMVETVEADEEDVSLVSRGPAGNVALRSRRGDSADLKGAIVTGGDGPDLRGWSASPGDVVQAFWQLIPRPCWTVSAAFRDEIVIVTAIRCFAPGARAIAPDLNLRHFEIPSGEARTD
jgi:hypothetical protein